MSAKVKINVNEKALVNNLKMAFSTGTTWVTELLQNARRAGATKIHIVLKPETKEFSIWDDGQGIEDMQNLFSIAQSGWDEPVLSQEKPYGMGFLSCLFACEKVHIVSRGQQVKVATKDAIAFDDIHVEPNTEVEGTFIHMEGVTNMPSDLFLHKVVKGFPVPVYLDQSNEPLGNPHAVGETMDWVKTEIGLVHISNLQSKFYQPIIYLQGLPIQAGFNSGYNDNNVIVHLDSEKFFGRLPDRASVIDPDKAMMAIKSAIIKLYVKHLREKKVDMLANGQAKEFVDRYGEICIAYCKDLLDDIPFLPGDAITGSIYDLSIMDDRVLSFPSEPISMQAVSEGKVRLFAGDNGSYDYENMPHMALVDAYDGVIVDSKKLSSNHWVHQYIHHLDGNIRISISEQQPSIGFDGRFVYGGEIVLCESLDLSGPFKVNGVPIEIGSTYDNVVYDAKEDTFYVPREASGYGAVRQASTYTDDDVYCEEAFEEDNDLFVRLVSEARNPDPEALLRQLLSDLWLKRYKSLQGKSYQVTIREGGAVEVTLA